MKQRKRNFELDRQIKEIEQAIQQYDDLSALGDKANGFDFFF